MGIDRDFLFSKKSEIFFLKSIILLQRKYDSSIKAILCRFYKKMHKILKKFQQVFENLISCQINLISLIDPRGRPQSRPVVITIFTQCPSVRPSIRPAQNLKIQRQSLPAGTVGWPSGSLMTPVLFNLISKSKFFSSFSFRLQIKLCAKGYSNKAGKKFKFQL